MSREGQSPKARCTKKWYANPVNQGIISKSQISKEISGRSSLTAGDISNVIENLIEELPKHLIAGNSVKLGEFGTFRLSILGEGSDTKDGYNVSNIKSATVVFTLGTELKKALDAIHYEKAD
ncbi:MAG: HU family DNA-binding protein [Bacteroidales bacterium]